MSFSLPDSLMGAVQADRSASHLAAMMDAVKPASALQSPVPQLKSDHVTQTCWPSPVSPTANQSLSRKCPAAFVVRTLDRASAAGGHRLLVLWEPEDVEIHSVPEGRRRGQAHPAGVSRLRGGGGLEQ